jgi:hypothetical protein
VHSQTGTATLNAVESADASRFPQGLCCKSSLCVSMTRHRPRSSSRAITPAFLAYCFRCTVRTWMHIFPIIIIYSQTYNCVSWPDHDAVCATLRSRTRLLFASFSNLDLFIALSTLCAVTTLTGLIFPFSACHADAYYGARSSRVENVQHARASMAIGFIRVRSGWSIRTREQPARRNAVISQTFDARSYLTFDTMTYIARLGFWHCKV